MINRQKIYSLHDEKQLHSLARIVHNSHKCVTSYINFSKFDNRLTKCVTSYINFSKFDNRLTKCVTSYINFSKFDNRLTKHGSCPSYTVSVGETGAS